MEEITKLAKVTSIPVTNIQAYLHITNLIKEMDIRNRRLFPKKTLKVIEKKLDDLRREKWLTKDVVLQIKKTINVEVFSNLDKRHIAQHAMALKPGLEYKKGGPPADWAKNFLIFALVQDAHYYSKGKSKYYKEIGIFIDELFEDEKNRTDKEFLILSDDVKKAYNRTSSNDIFKLLKHCCRYCLSEGKSFLPADLTISEIPDNFLTILSHRSGFKPSSYLSSPGKAGNPLPSTIRGK